MYGTKAKTLVESLRDEIEDKEFKIKVSGSFMAENEVNNHSMRISSNINMNNLFLSQRLR